jgi:hypothetical protein
MANEIVEATLAQMTSMGKKLRGLIRELSADVKTLKETGGQANVVERIKVNGRVLTPDGDKTVDVPVPTKVGELTNDAGYQANTLEHVQVNGAELPIADKTANVPVPTAVSQLTNDSGYQPNVLEGIKVNGLAQEIDSSKDVDISIPTKVSELTNDKTYQTKTEVENTVKTAVAGSKHTSFQKVSSVPATADAKEDVMYLVMNSVTKHYDIYAKIADDAGNFKMELLDDTTVDLSGYVQKEAGKGLSHNDFTDALLAKLNGIAEKANNYVHPSHTAYAEGLYKMTVNVLGHVTKATAVSKEDITGLGIPGQDTHDWASITDKPKTFAPSEHTHDNRYYTETEIDTKLSSKSDTGHKHVKADITDFPASMPANGGNATTAQKMQTYKAGSTTETYGSSYPVYAQWQDSKIVALKCDNYTTKVDSATSADSAKAVAWDAVSGKPSSFTPSSHTHDDRYYTESEMNAKLSEKLSLSGGTMTGQLHVSGTAASKPLQVRGIVGCDSDGTTDGELHLQYGANAPIKLGNDAAYSISADGGTYTGKANTAGTADSAKSVAWGNVTGKPATYPPSSHTHTKSQITDFPTLGTAAAKNVGDFAAAGHNHDSSYYKKSEIDTKLSGVAVSGHTHKKADITDFPTSMPASDVSAWAKAATKPSYAWSEITGKPSTFNPASHTHDDRYYTESEINSKLGEKAESVVLAADANLNNITTPGIYSCGGGNSIANKPSGLDAIGLIVVHNASGGYYTQILTSSSNANTYRRTCLNDTWSTWTQDKYTDTNTWRGIQNNLTSDSTSDSLSAAQGKALKTLVDGKAANGHTHTKSQVGLGNVDNTADANKSVKYATSAGSASSATKATSADSAGKLTMGDAQTALSGTASPTAGLTVNKVYNNGYPTAYGNVITVHGSGSGQIVAGWSGASGAVERLYYRNKRDTSDANWSPWKTLAFTDDKPSAAGTADVANSVDWSKVQNKPSTFTPATHSHAWGDVTGKPSTFAPSAHKHVKADITDFPKSLPASDVSAWAKAANKPSYSWGEITNKPSTFTPAGHKHVKADITDFPTLGTAAAKNVGDFAAASHSHSWDSVTGKPTTFAPSSHNHDDRYYTESEMDTKLGGKANSSHTHNYAGSGSAGGTANSVNGFTFGVQTSDPGANSSLATNKFLFVYE